MKLNSNLLFDKFGVKGFYHFLYLTMILSLTGSVYSLLVTWNLINNIGARVSSISGLFMQFLFTIFFKYLRDTSPSVNPKNEDLKTNDDMLKLLEGGKNEEEHKTSG